MLRDLIFFFVAAILGAVLAQTLMRYFGRSLAIRLKSREFTLHVPESASTIMQRIRSAARSPVASHHSVKYDLAVINERTFVLQRRTGTFENLIPGTIEASVDGEGDRTSIKARLYPSVAGLGNGLAAVLALWLWFGYQVPFGTPEHSRPLSDPVAFLMVFVLWPAAVAILTLCTVSKGAKTWEHDLSVVEGLIKGAQ